MRSLSVATLLTLFWTHCYLARLGTTSQIEIAFSTRCCSALDGILKGRRLTQDVQTAVKKFKRRIDRRRLPCPDYQAASTSEPTSVHELRVGDIDVVAALGDIVTSATGALSQNMFSAASRTHYRGHSWSIGGDSSYTEGVTTLPNILKQFNPNLIGYSVGVDVEGAHLNMATSGSFSSEMLRQAVGLVERIEGDPRIDVERDWKMVTLLAGGSDLCFHCKNKDRFSPDAYKRSIRNAIDYLYRKLPRTYVNLVEIFDMSPIVELGESSATCRQIHQMHCSCAAGASTDPSLTNLTRLYQQAMDDLVKGGRYDNKVDFTVVDQPMFRNSRPQRLPSGEIDKRYFALGCFPFSGKGHNAAGRALWNNIMEPVGYKSTTWSPADPVKCPLINNLNMPAPPATRLSIYSDAGLKTPVPSYAYRQMDAQDDIMDMYDLPPPVAVAPTPYQSRSAMGMIPPSRINSPDRYYQYFNQNLGGTDMAVAALPQLPMGPSASAMPTYHRVQPTPPTCQRQSWAGYGVSNDYVVDSSAGMPSRMVFKKKYTLPLNRSGRSGGQWRHIQQSTGQTGSNILFIEGSVKDHDVKSYPPFGILQPEVKYNVHGQRLLSRRLTKSASNRDNQYNQRAKSGFQYWYKEPTKNVTQVADPPCRTISGHQFRTTGVGFHN